MFDDIETPDYMECLPERREADIALDQGTLNAAASILQTLAMKVHAGHSAARAGFFQESQNVAIAAPDF
jgi:hypothetical protein